MQVRLTLCAFAAVLAFAQPPAPGPQFEVASIKPSPPLDPQALMAGKMHLGMSVDAARVDIGGTSLADLIRIAYKLKQYQVTGPDWMTAQRFDILAKMPEGATKDNVPAMLQGLLAERFKLTSHRETKDHAVYALIVGKSGSKLQEAAGEPASAPAADGAPPAKGTLVVGSGDSQMKIEPNKDGKGATIANPAFGQMKVSMGDAGMMRMEFARMSMPTLAEMLTRFLDKPVVDQTELKGNYQLSLDLSMDEMRNMARAMAASSGIALPAGGGHMGGGGENRSGPAESASTPGGSSIFGAVQQLGLKLDSRKLPVEILVVDHLEKAPTEN